MCQYQTTACIMVKLDYGNHLCPTWHFSLWAPEGDGYIQVLHSYWSTYILFVIVHSRDDMTKWGRHNLELPFLVINYRIMFSRGTQGIILQLDITVFTNII